MPLLSSISALLIVGYSLQENFHLGDDMDVDAEEEDEVVDDDLSEEAPSEHDLDEAEGKAESHQHDPPSDDDVAICQTPMEEPDSAPHAYNVSPLQAKTLDFASSSQAHMDEEEDEDRATQNEEAEEHGQGVEHDDDHHHHASPIEATPPTMSDADIETRSSTPPSPAIQANEPSQPPPNTPIPPISEVAPSANTDTPKRTSRGSSRGSKDRHK